MDFWPTFDRSVQATDKGMAVYEYHNQKYETTGDLDEKTGKVVYEEYEQDDGEKPNHYKRFKGFKFMSVNMDRELNFWGYASGLTSDKT